MRGEFGRIFSGLITYLERRYRDNYIYFSDIFNFRQFKYGHLVKNESSPDKVYLVDIEPILHSPFLKMNGYTSILNSIRDLDQNIAVVEKILGKFPELSKRLDGLASEVYLKDQEYRQKQLLDFEKDQNEE